MTEKTDAYHGQGGSYLLDPKTGERVLIQRTLEKQPADPPAHQTKTEKSNDLA